METSQNYELAYHLDSNLEEIAVSELKEKIEKEITSRGGSIGFSKPPERIRLSYPLKRQSTSFFGYVQFSAPTSDSLAELGEQLKLNAPLLRFLLIKLESDLQKQRSMLQQAKMKERLERQTKAKAAERAKKVETEAGKEKIDEKKLEEIIEKL